MAEQLKGNPSFSEIDWWVNRKHFKESGIVGVGIEIPNAIRYLPVSKIIALLYQGKESQITVIYKTPQKTRVRKFTDAELLLFQPEGHVIRYGKGPVERFRLGAVEKTLGWQRWNKADFTDQDRESPFSLGNAGGFRDNEDWHSFDWWGDSTNLSTEGYIPEPN